MIQVFSQLGALRQMEIIAKTFVYKKRQPKESV